MKKCTRALLLIAALLLAVPANPAIAASYDVDADSTGFVLPAKSTVFGNQAAWIANQHIFHANITSKEKRQLTTVASFKDTIAFHGDLIVWEDKREIDAKAQPAARHIILYNLATNKEKVISWSPAQHVNPSTDGKFIAWYNRDTRGDMYLYDSDKDATELLGQGRYPIVSNGLVVYKQAGKDGLNMLDLGTKADTVLYEAERGNYIAGFAFQGNTVIWKIRNFDGLTHYMAMKINTPGAEPVQLTQPSKKDREFPIMAAGDNVVAWVEDVNGVAQIMAADLKTNETFQATHGTTDQTFLKMENDKMITKAADGRLTVLTVVPANTATGSKQDTSPQPVISVDSITRKIGAEGGTVESADGAFKLIIPAGAFDQTADITVKRESVSKSAAEGFVPKSDAWTVTSSRPFAAAAKMTLAYASSGMTGLDHEKTGLFLQNGEQWTYLGGTADAAASAATAVWTKQEGTVAVAQRNASFKDLSAHWAKDAVEVLAAKNIVNGFEDGTYRPDTQVTRAQFVKLLAGIFGLQAVSSGNEGHFADVGRNHWAFGVVEAAAKAGWVQGDGGSFHPDAPVTREQMSAMIVRAMGAKAPVLQLEETEGLLKFKDAATISGWAKANVAAVVKLGLLKGSDGQVMPLKTTTRAEAATVVYRLLPLVANE
ncbi:S-layer homology domain-containing protein [Paenibacillus alkalitolerans]|uniref:S-layer homology domain-containing protein n=1 Tax=Paenibacillus alkalitolerans TaxID=2799335 RepID=UPI0018F42D24|nr:S-layer homology domain-containing protein [Paenibacillus alkalitolerans]